MENHAALALTFALFAFYAFFGRCLETSVLSGSLLFTTLDLCFAVLTILLSGRRGWGVGLTVGTTQMRCGK